jgi:hypothetical protein
MQDHAAEGMNQQGLDDEDCLRIGPVEKQGERRPETDKELLI